MKVFVETGTFLGDTVEMMLSSEHAFDLLYSVELDLDLAVAAQHRFAAEDRVAIVQGSSPDVLKQILRPEWETTFYLDAHRTGMGNAMRRKLRRRFTAHDARYGECPVLRELDAILDVDWHVGPQIVIDDAHMFDHSDDFWATNLGQKYRKAQWPTTEQIVEKLRGYSVSKIKNKRERPALLATLRREEGSDESFRSDSGV